MPPPLVDRLLKAGDQLVHVCVLRVGTDDKHYFVETIHALLLFSLARGEFVTVTELNFRGSPAAVHYSAGPFCSRPFSRRLNSFIAAMMPFATTTSTALRHPVENFIERRPDPVFRSGVSR